MSWRLGVVVANFRHPSFNSGMRSAMNLIASSHELHSRSFCAANRMPRYSNQVGKNPEKTPIHNPQAFVIVEKHISHVEIIVGDNQWGEEGFVKRLALWRGRIPARRTILCEAEFHVEMICEILRCRKRP